MSRFRKIDPRIWNDEKFRRLSDPAKLVMFLLVTHPNMTSLGAMRATPAGLAEELGWTTKVFGQAFAEVLASGMAEHDAVAHLIALPNFIRYNAPQSPNVVRAWAGAVDLLPECGLKVTTLLRARAFACSMSEAFGQAFDKAFGKPMPNKEKEKEKEQKQEQKTASPIQGEELSGYSAGGSGPAAATRRPALAVVNGGAASQAGEDER
jgi:hypothetical protein